MSKVGMEDDQLFFAEEILSHGESDSEPVTPWNILVVDDELDVHQVTRLSLKGLTILGRPLNIVNASSAAEAEIQLTSSTEFSVILLDVVMETEDAGLQLVRKIRDELGNYELRIILRTGQPGQAPETEAISNYDINDYRLKTELTRVHLVTSLTAAIRSYQQIKTINQTSKHLAFIVDSSNKLMKETSLYSFGINVLDSVTSLLDIEHDAFLSKSIETDGERSWLCVAGNGMYSKYVNCHFDADSDSEIIFELEASLTWPKWISHKQRSSLYISKNEGANFVFSVADNRMPTELQLQSLQILMATIAVGLENQSLVDSLSQLAWKDTLTQLPNRAKILHILDSVVMVPDQHDLYILDIDDFDTVNDGLGQEMGNLTLIEVGRRLQALEGDSLVCARLAGDTFAILGSHEELSDKKIQSIFETPLSINKTEIRLTASMGMVKHVHDSKNGEDAVRRATLALHRAKSTNRGQCVDFDPQMEDEVNERLQMVGGLYEAIRTNRLCLHYQPKVSHPDGNIMGMEALMRWPIDNGFVSPFKFIPVAESSGLIFEVEYFLIRQVCIDLQRLEEANLGHLTVAVNVSIMVLESDDFFTYLKLTLEQYHIAPSKIYIELTESMTIRNQALIIERLSQFRELGVKCSLDDFGTGYNSLTYLNVLPIDQIKIDKSFVDNIHTSERTRYLNEAIINLAHHLKLEVIAEGIEYPEQYQILSDLNCDQTQGYLFSRPIPIEELIPWIKAQET